ncbi:hypothetical protein [Methylobacterium frigidaeris]|uniref:Uncharacterized protein n=1 Tax=Methylobacterium frigidaeris TaxID=2038277 RepID=A0AA37HG35_9HYPH|nr:hypothetical protein [Methylobacterium frigidaeris]PIK70534.1 hypothetical protein CS379_24190 [Methylobacterium frigidaeris]GJD65129.1 hypothetical protein MPEAHAMD_5316 [Methylobacterium frigidaeris]
MSSTPETDRLLALAHNLGIDDETFARVLAEVMAKAEADPDWGRPHEVIAEMRARLLALATGPEGAAEAP